MTFLSRTRWRPALKLSAAGLLLGAVPGYAQQVEYTLGFGAMYEPDYEGSDDYETTPVPIIEITVNERFQFSTLDGPALTATIVDNNGFSLEAGVGYSFGRQASDNAALGGLGDIDDSVSFIAAAAYEFDLGAGSMSFGFDAERELSGNRKGTEIALEASYGVPVFSQRGMFTLSAGSTWADKNYMATTFGVTAAQAAASTAGVTAYTANAGFKDITLSAGIAYELREGMMLVGEVGLTRLIGDAKNAPIVKDFGSPDQKFAAFGVAYSW